MLHTYTSHIAFFQFKNDHNVGIISRALQEFFTYSADKTHIKLQISYYEIYNKKVYDLLRDNKNMIQVKGKIIILKNTSYYSLFHD